MDNDLRVIDVVVSALRDAPPKTKRGLWLVLLAWAAMFVLQLFDIRGRHGPRVWAEMASVLLYTAGTSIVALMYALRGASELSACAHDGAVGSRERPAVRRILLALPSLGLIASAMLAAGIAVLFTRVLLGSSPIMFVLALVNLGVLIAAARIVTRATRFLYRYAQEQAVLAAQAEAQAVEARLSALQAQMNPHFLFNALNTVASLVRTDPRSAETTVENLSEVLRRTLERSRTMRGTVGDELNYIKAYLAVEEQRLGDRLTVEWAIAPDVLGLPLPPLTLQPLVENAIKHGIGPRRAGGRVRIAAARAGDRLRLVVEDDGEGFLARHGDGTGLGNLRTRIDALYGAAASVRVESPGAGARVVVELPAAIENTGHASPDR